MDDGRADGHVAGDRVDLAVLELAGDEDLALALGEPAHAGHEPAQVLTLLQHDDRIAPALGLLLERVVAEVAAVERVEGQVARHAVQPRPQQELAVVVAQEDVGLHERLLHDVLGVIASDEPRAVAHQRPAVAVHDRLEGARRVLAGERHEAGVALQLEDHAGSDH